MAQGMPSERAAAASRMAFVAHAVAHRVKQFDRARDVARFGARRLLREAAHNVVVEIEKTRAPEIFSTGCRFAACGSMDHRAIL